MCISCCNRVSISDAHVYSNTTSVLMKNPVNTHDFAAINKRIPCWYSSVESEGSRELRNIDDEDAVIIS